MTTSSSGVAYTRQKLAARWGRVEERIWPLREFERLRVPSAAALTVICDDGQTEDLAVVDVLSRAGAHGVFAISPDLIGRPGFMSYAQLRQVRDAGHEIAFHGTTHEPFTGQQPASLQASLHTGMAQLADQGLVATTLVYPYGANNRRVRAAVAPAFDCAFTTWSGLNQRVTNRYALRRLPFGAYAGRTPRPEAWYLRCIERATAGDCWPTLMLHPGVSTHTRSHNEMLARLLQHARECGVPVRTARQHIAEAGPRLRDEAQPRSRQQPVTTMAARSERSR
jgi:peptidoglycan/xylan/chitin deacetylase (PgdA/CDA1 family)